ncbi:hypothetical protein EGR_11077 [Echinococcus granulosus]|uniref:Uncharacterized protein n=1 Tax=Echinococcus granulosus TaxID=6210 RepID=W6U0T7_ECHGR|nr:hypothetical protein EGR_11077 [Echinococcus granulosus]EUB54061.1 hypothetical protein EGR_11077 [Echinococcus granulosus]
MFFINGTATGVKGHELISSNLPFIPLLRLDDDCSAKSISCSLDASYLGGGLG